MSVSTPSRTSAPQTAPSTTPHVTRSMSQVEFGTILHETRREHALLTTPIYPVDLATFCQLMPPLPDLTRPLADILAAPSPLLEYLAQLPGGTAFDARKHEDELFAIVTPLTKYVVQWVTRHAAIPILPTLEIDLRPHSAPGSNPKPDRSRPDGTLKQVQPPEVSPEPPTNTPASPTPPTPDPSAPSPATRPPASTGHAPYVWWLIWLTMEFKKKLAQDLFGGLFGRENASEILWDLHHTLWANPDRVSAWGLTIDGSWMRLWLAHREGVHVSESVDIQKNPTALIESLARFCFASLEAMGLDPHMKRIHDPRSPLRKQAEQYAADHWMQLPNERGPKTIVPMEITVAGVAYVLASPLADFRARSLCGTACRVWLAFKQNEGRLDPTPLAIKIVWRHSARPSEASVYYALRAAIMKTQGLTEQQVAQYYVDIVGDEDFDKGTFTIHKAILRGIALPPTVPLRALPNDSADRPTETVGSARSSSSRNSEAPHGRFRPPPSQEPAAPQVAPDRTYSAMVMDTVTTPLHLERNLSRKLHAAADCIMGWMLAIRAGWRVRDISGGNLGIKRDGSGLILDTEFAKAAGDTQEGRGERTGTPDFMAPEILVMEWHYRTPRPGVPPVPFHSHYGHDGDSFFFVILLAILESTYVGAKPEMLAGQFKLLDEIFGTAQRDNDWYYSNSRLHNALDRIFKGTDFEPLTWSMQTMLSALKDGHQAWAKVEPEQWQLSTWITVAEVMQAALIKMSEAVQTIETTALPPRKRRTEQSRPADPVTPTRPMKKSRTEAV